jgi:hypothetical protein
MLEVVERLKAGDHVALFYRSKAEQFACVVPYIKIGLERKERCLYIADDNSVPMIWRKLGEGIDVNRAHKRGDLEVVTKRETYLRHGIFEPAKMISDLRREVEKSLELGYTAFRATGEMTWALDLPSALARLMEYEANLHVEFPKQFLGLCQYDETRFPEHVISEMIQIHPKVIARDQLMEHDFYRPNWRDVAHQERATVGVEQLVGA